MTGEVVRRRAERSDRGTIRQTARDAQALEWIAQMYGVPLDVAARVLGTTEAAAREVIRRWKAAGWVLTGQVDAGPLWVWPTRAIAAQYLGWDPGTYRPRPTTAAHLRATAETRLSLCGTALDGWTPERELRHRAGFRRRGDKLPHIPDGIWHRDGGGLVLVEVELTAKSPDRLREVLGEVMRAADERGARLLYVAAPEAARAVERARDELIERFPQGIGGRLRDGMEPVRAIEEVRRW